MRRHRPCAETTGVRGSCPPQVGALLDAMEPDEVAVSITAKAGIPAASYGDLIASEPVRRARRRGHARLGFSRRARLGHIDPRPTCCRTAGSGTNEWRAGFAVTVDGFQIAFLESLTPSSTEPPQSMGFAEDANSTRRAGARGQRAHWPTCESDCRLRGRSLVSE